MTRKEIYHIHLLGEVPDDLYDSLKAYLESHLSPFGLRVNEEVMLHVNDTIRDEHQELSSVIVFVAGAGTYDCNVEHLVNLPIPIITASYNIANLYSELPNIIGHINACNLNEVDGINRLSATILNQLGLLPDKRSVFVSYKRSESTEAAEQLSNFLILKKYQVFLDTYSVSEARDFQEELWHRLINSDVVIMLDTNNFFDSHWAVQEIRRANLCQISIVRVGWPDVGRQKQFSFCEDLTFTRDDFEQGLFSEDALDKLSNIIELSRSQSIARRHKELADEFFQYIRRMQYDLSVCGAGRYIEVKSDNKFSFIAKSVIGAPDSAHVEEIKGMNGVEKVKGYFLLHYDNGLKPKYKEHLEWLQREIEDISISSPRDAAYEISEKDIA